MLSPFLPLSAGGQARGGDTWLENRPATPFRFGILENGFDIFARY
jgi:hypothetical protein